MSKEKEINNTSTQIDAEKIADKKPKGKRTFKQKFFMGLYCVFAKNLPLSYHCTFAKKLRRFFAKRVLKSMGKQVNIEKGAYFSSLCSLGDFSGIGVNAEINGDVTIGAHVMMGPNVTVYTTNHETSRTDIPMWQQGETPSRPVVIEDDVWIGKNVIILPGVTIGKGSIIGAGAIVTKSVPPYSVACGNPAKVVKSRLENKENQ